MVCFIVLVIADVRVETEPDSMTAAAGRPTELVDRRGNHFMF